MRLVMEADPRKLEELILDGQVAKLLSLVTLEQVAAAWCGYCTRTHLSGVEDDDPDWWAVFLLQVGEFWSDELRVRTVIDLLVELAPDDKVLGAVGAGPLEDFISDNEDRLVWIERRAAVSARFKEALRHVWIWSLGPNVLARVERAVGEELARPTNKVEIVPGELPGTIHIKVNDELVEETETDVEHVEELIRRLRRHS
jgi:hypothetical protein